MPVLHPQQLAVLLKLRPDELTAFLAGRPYPDLFNFRRALPFRVAATVKSFDIPKVDLNSLSEDDLTKHLGVEAGTAEAIVKARPFYFTKELRRVPGVTSQVFGVVSSVADVPELTYVDKTSGQSQRLATDASKVLVRFNETEEAGPDLTEVVNVKPTFSTKGKKKGGGIQVFSLPDTEDADDVFGKIKEQPGVDKAVPGFRQGSTQRFLDPEFCIVQFHESVSKDRQDQIIAECGLELAEPRRMPSIVSLRVPEARARPGALALVLQALDAHSEVKLAEPNFLGFDDFELGAVAPRAIRSTTSARWHLDLIRLAEAWAFGKGAPEVVLAIVDSGVDVTHPVIKEGVLQRKPNDDWDFASDSGTGAPDDQLGHGTFIAGLLVGNGNSSVQGICPGCKLLPLKIPTAGETNSYVRRAAAIHYAVEYAGKRRLVINLSWKTTGDVAVVREAIRAARAKGAIIVTSAGNNPDDPDTGNDPHFPSDYPECISVAAVKPDRKRPRYSFFGDQIDLSAPGGTGDLLEDIRDRDPKDPTLNVLSIVPSNKTAVLFGTSFAAPHVAGVTALILSRNSALTPTEVESILKRTAVPLEQAGMGHGLVNGSAGRGGSTNGADAGTATATRTGSNRKRCAGRAGSDQRR